MAILLAIRHTVLLTHVPLTHEVRLIEKPIPIGLIPDSEPRVSLSMIAAIVFLLCFSLFIRYRKELKEDSDLII